MSISGKPQVFISYAHDDLDTVRKLYSDLIEREVNVWFDNESTTPGKWKTQIQKATPKSRYFLFCISQTALQKTEQGSGFVDDELQQAYEIAMAQDDRHFTIVPVRLEKDISHGDHRLSIFQQYDLFDDWDNIIDILAQYLGGKPLAQSPTKNEGMEENVLLNGILGKAEAALYAKEFNKALQFIGALASLKSNWAEVWFFRASVLGEIGSTKKPCKILKRA